MGKVSFSTNGAGTAGRPHRKKKKKKKKILHADLIHLTKINGKLAFSCRATGQGSGVVIASVWAPAVVQVLPRVQEFPQKLQEWPKEQQNILPQNDSSA